MLFSSTTMPLDLQTNSTTGPTTASNRLLSCIRGDAFGSRQSLRWIEGFVRHVLGPEACGGDVRAAAVARWLAGQIGDGALAHTTRRSASRESRDELREAWRDLCEALPKAWLVETPVDSQTSGCRTRCWRCDWRGVVPCAIRPSVEASRHQAPQLDHERLDRALYTLGRRLEAGRRIGAFAALPASPRRRHCFSQTRRPSHGRTPGWAAVAASDQVDGGPGGSLVHRRVAPPVSRTAGYSLSLESEVSDYDGTDGTRPEIAFPTRSGPSWNSRRRSTKPSGW